MHLQGGQCGLGKDNLHRFEHRGLSSQSGQGPNLRSGRRRRKVGLLCIGRILRIGGVLLGGGPRRGAAAGGWFAKICRFGLGLGIVLCGGHSQILIKAKAMCRFRALQRRFSKGE